MTKSSAQNIYEFEDFRLDAAHLMLYRDGEEISIAPKAAQTLLVLIERRGEILGKGELMETIWKDSIVEEANLTQYIHILRKVLGTSADGKPLIETLRRRGYRFNGDVRCIAVSEKELPEEISVLPPIEDGTSYYPVSQVLKNAAPFETPVLRTESENKIVSPIEKSRRGILLTPISLVALVGLLILAGAAFFNSGNKKMSAETDFSGIKLKRLTPDENVIQPTISPDGKYLLYSSSNKDTSTTLRLKDLTSRSAVQIMHGGQYLDFAFSADGRQIYYLTPDYGGPNNTLARIPLFGGKPQIILRNVLSPPAVSPDGKLIAIITGNAGLTILNEYGETENTFESLMPNFTPVVWNSQMSWSPDGERIAICGKTDDGQARILDFSIKNKTGQFLPLTNFSEIDDAIWLTDASGLMITAKEKSGEPFQVWQVAYPSGEARRITRDFNDYTWISLPADSKTLIAGQNITKTNVWLTSSDDLENPKQLTFGSEAQDGFRGLAFALDGKIIFTSPRSGNVDLWQMDRDGGSQQPLTADQGSLNISPRVTSDGRYIVFASSRGGDTLHIWRMDADGQNLLQLTNGTTGGERFFDVSSDGSRVYYATPNDQKQMTTLQVSIDGGEPSAIADSYRSSGAIATSPDGKFLMRYIYLPEREQTWFYGIFPVAGGEPLKLLKLPAYRNLARWTADSKSFLYIKPGTAQLWRQPSDGGSPVMMADLKTGWLFNFAISPDHKQIAFVRGSQFSEAVLIENFGKQ